MAVETRLLFEKTADNVLVLVSGRHWAPSSLFGRIWLSSRHESCGSRWARGEVLGNDQAGAAKFDRRRKDSVMEDRGLLACARCQRYP